MRWLDRNGVRAQKSARCAESLAEPRSVGSVIGRRVSGSATRPRTGGTFFGSLSAVGWFDADQAHHASVFVFEKMTVIYESADGVGVAKIHAQADAGVF